MGPDPALETVERDLRVEYQAGKTTGIADRRNRCRNIAAGFRVKADDRRPGFGKPRNQRLDGFDRALPLFGNDIDLGWRANLAGHPVVLCPDAVVYHAEAAAHGRRRLAAVRRRAHLVDRRHALYVLTANTSALLLPLVMLRLALGGLELLGQLAYGLGGRVAEQLVFGDITTGANDDLQKASPSVEISSLTPSPGRQV